MARSDLQMKIRLPEELRAMVESAATKSGRSMNQEIVNRLYRSFSDIDSFMIRNRMSELKLVRQQLQALRHQHNVLLLAASHDEPGLDAEIGETAMEIRRLENMAEILANEIHHLSGADSPDPV